MTFLENSQLIEYNEERYLIAEVDYDKPLHLEKNDDHVDWLNIYGFHWKDEIKTIIKENKLNDFLNVLVFEENQNNKMIDLETSLFITINVLIKDGDDFQYDRIKFFYQDSLLWTIQEKKGDYFGEVREYIRENKGLVRRKKGDYLLYKLLEAIIDNYEIAYSEISKAMELFQDLDKIKPEPEFVVKIEESKQDLMILKKSLLNLKEVLVQLENWQDKEFHNHYFNLLKEKINFIVDDVDFDLQQLESNLNLIFNLQSHKLNEIMKMLTILSAVFIPLTFLAGIYGMNFQNIPETQTQYGYFFLLGAMLIIGALTVYYFKRKKWF